MVRSHSSALHFLDARVLVLLGCVVHQNVQLPEVVYHLLDDLHSIRKTHKSTQKKWTKQKGLSKESPVSAFARLPRTEGRPGPSVPTTHRGGQLGECVVC